MGAVRDSGNFLVGAAISRAARGGLLDLASFCRRRESGGAGCVRGVRREQAIAGSVSRATGCDWVEKIIDRAGDLCRIWQFESRFGSFCSFCREAGRYLW